MKKVKAEKREKRAGKKTKMLISGKSVFGLQKIIIEKSKKEKK